jgi:hypothetical protein
MTNLSSGGRKKNRICFSTEIVFLLPQESKSDIEKLEYFRAIIRSKYLPKNSNNRSTYHIL